MGRMTGKHIPDPPKPPSHGEPCCNGVISRIRLKAAGLPLELPTASPGEWAGPGYCSQKWGQSTTHQGEGRCIHHDGKQWVGPANPNYIDGRATRLERYLPERYRKGYTESLDNPLVQREQAEQLAVIDQMVQETLGRFDTSESGAAWKRVHEHARTCKELQDLMDIHLDNENLEMYTATRDELLACMRADLLPSILQGAREDEARDELLRLFRERASLLKVQAQMERTVPVEVLGIVLVKTVHIIAEEVDDKRVLSRLVDRLRREPVPGLEDYMRDAAEARGEAGAKVKQAKRVGTTKHGRARTQDDGTIDITPRAQPGAKSGKGQARDASSAQDVAVPTPHEHSDVDTSSVVDS